MGWGFRVLKSLIASCCLLSGLAAANAADSAMPLKAPVRGADDGWAGYYLGAHFGYAGGTSDWTAAGAAPLAGSVDLFKGYDPFKGTGSYFAGFQGGYNVVLPSRFLLGVEADVSFPNALRGDSLIIAPAIGQASYAEFDQMFGTFRARFGHVYDHWLVYGTAGLAWSYERFVRTQIVGTPIGGIAVPGDDETLYKIRLGWTAGAGVEFPVAPHWSARFEYLFAGFGAHTVNFPAGAQRFDSDLSIHTVRAGLNYRIGELATFKGISAPDADNWAFHAQTTFLQQVTPGFRSPYLGRNSLVPKQGRETWDVTLYAGLRLWSGAEFWINPEIDQGFGLSGTLGVAGFTSGEAYKVGESVPYARLPRMFIRQTINLGGASRRSRLTSTSSPERKPRTGWCSRSASSSCPTCSTPTNTRTIPARIYELGDR